MPSYTTSLRLVQPSDGDVNWGTTVNTGLTALVDTAIAGTASVSMTTADYTLTNVSGATDEARAMVLSLAGSPGAARNVICPAVSKVYVVYNNTGFAQTLKTLSGTGVAVPNGATALLRCDGVNVLPALNYLTLQSAGETATISATAATGTINYDATAQSVLYYTTNASGNWTVNFRASSGTSLNTVMTTGQSLTVAFLVTQGTTAYYNAAVQVDGVSVTPKWQGGVAPSVGNASSVDVYVYTIIKTGAATFTVFASQTNFA